MVDTSKTREQICSIASNLLLTKQLRNEKIADLVVKFLMSSGRFEMNSGEIRYYDNYGYWEDDGYLGTPLHSLLNERQHNDLLDQLGVYPDGSYNTYIAAVVRKLVLGLTSASPERQEYVDQVMATWASMTDAERDPSWVTPTRESVAREWAIGQARLV
jgi:hypothetical protein